MDKAKMKYDMHIHSKCLYDGVLERKEIGDVLIFYTPNREG